MKAATLAALLSLVTAPVLIAQTPGSSPCAGPEFRQFDFWIGDWIVENPAGQVVGENRIKRILGGCALQESWTGRSGGLGHSYNAWDAATRRWHQTWVSNSGGVLLLDGALDGASMVLRGPGRAAGGREIVNRITWTPQPDGRVRQHWEVSDDGGRSWRTTFDGWYRRRA